ncbi:MAG: hypothetical protein JNM14_10480 [Ferruginibacter sp.]|nr:hypothetical protein [Ferruginibacter sp.]
MVRIIYTCCAFFLFMAGCKKHDTLPVATRTFYMGVTPWPADFTVAEVDTAYRFINEHCDIVSHHFDDGIPYEEVFYHRPMPANFIQDVNTRKTKTAAGKKVFLSVSALSVTRLTKPEYYQNVPVSDSIRNYWRQLSFDDNKMITVYVDYISWLIDQFQPVYVNYGVESNVSTWNETAFLKYKNFLSQVYQQLKTKYTAIPFFISFIVDETNEGYNNAAQLIAYTDFMGLSAYPYVTVSSSANGNTDPKLFPAGYFEKFTNLAAAKPVAFAETGYIAEDLVIPSFSLNKQGNAGWQKDYLEMALKFCNDKKAKLFVWFCSKDYDAGSNTLRNLNLYQDIFGLWEDTGLKDENGNARAAYTSWQEWIDKTIIP